MCGWPTIPPLTTPAMIAAAPPTPKRHILYILYIYDMWVNLAPHCIGAGRRWNGAYRNFRKRDLEHLFLKARSLLGMCDLRVRFFKKHLSSLNLAFRRGVLFFLRINMLKKYAETELTEDSRLECQVWLTGYGLHKPAFRSKVKNRGQQYGFCALSLSRPLCSTFADEVARVLAFLTEPRTD